VLAGRRVARPIDKVTADDIRHEIDARRRNGRIAEGVTDRDILSTVEYELNVREQTVQAGQNKRWEFNLPSQAAATGGLQLRFKFSSSTMDDAERGGTWTFGTRSDPNQEVIAGTWTPFQVHHIDVAGEQLESVVVVQFENPLLGRGGSLIFDVEDGIVLLNRESGFFANYFRSVLVVFLELAFLAALGLSTGSLFSQPVAVFASYSILVMAGLAQYLGISITEDPHLPILYEPLPVPVINAFVEHVARISHAITRPVLQFNVLSRMSQGVLVPWSLVGSALLVLTGLYSIALGIIGILIFRRREIGVPRI
jgi:hypothetical protein